MESGTWQLSQVGKIRALQLKQFKRLKELKRNGAAFATRISDGQYISHYPAKKDSVVIIPVDMLSTNEPILLCIEGDFFAMQISEICENLIKFAAWNITKQTALKIKHKKAFYTE